MKAITLTQPWATLVAIGAKQIETRSWSTSYRGPLAIHAAKTMPTYAKEFASGCEVAYNVLRQAGYTTRLQMQSYSLFWDDMNWLPSGAIIATCELVGVDQFGYWINMRDSMNWVKGDHYFDLTEQEREFGDYTIGRFGWFLADIKALPKPIPAKGALGLWEWNP